MGRGTMRAINPFVVLDVDESATRAEIDDAHRRRILENHPDRFAMNSSEEQQRATARTAEINEAHRLLTDPEYAARHKRKIDGVRARGIPVEPAPKRRDDMTVTSADTDGTSRTMDYREAAAREFNVSSEREATPWVAPVRRRRFRRR